MKKVIAGTALTTLMMLGSIAIFSIIGIIFGEPISMETVWVNTQIVGGIAGVLLGLTAFAWLWQWAIRTLEK